jgi:hypothetical protein
MKNKITTSIKRPIGLFGDISGYRTGEEWWEYHFEQLNNDVSDHFEAVCPCYGALRSEGIPSSLDAEMSAGKHICGC